MYHWYENSKFKKDKKESTTAQPAQPSTYVKPKRKLIKHIEKGIICRSMRWDNQSRIFYVFLKLCMTNYYATLKLYHIATSDRRESCCKPLNHVGCSPTIPACHCWLFFVNSMQMEDQGWNRFAISAYWSYYSDRYPSKFRKRLRPWWRNSLGYKRGCR